MSEPMEAAHVETGGDDTFDAEFEAARQADDGVEVAAQPEEKPEGEAKAEEKPPLAPEELAKRNEDLKRATRAERLKRQEADKRAAELEARLAELEAQVKAPKPEAKERPDPTEDPIGYMEWLNDRLDAAAAEREQEAQQTEAQKRQQAAVQAVVSRVEEFENDFREANPDYDNAAEHLYGAKMAEYLDAGYSQPEAHNMVMAEFLTRSERALKTGKDPAEIVYNLARKYGFGDVQAGEAAKKAEQEARAKLERVAAGQAAASPLATAGGRGSDDFEMSEIVNLEGAAFDAAFDKLMKKAQRAGMY